MSTLSEKQTAINEVNTKWQKEIDRIDAQFQIDIMLASPKSARIELIDKKDEDYFKASHIRNLALENIEQDYSDKGWI